MRSDISFPCMEQPPRCYITITTGTTTTSTALNESCGSTTATTLTEEDMKHGDLQNDLEQMILQATAHNNNNNNDNSSTYFKKPTTTPLSIQRLALRCHNRPSSGNLQLLPATQLTAREEWILVPEQEEATGICKIVNRSHELGLAAIPTSVDNTNTNTNSQHEYDTATVVAAPLWSSQFQQEQENGDPMPLTDIQEDCFLWNIEPQPSQLSSQHHQQHQQQSHSDTEERHHAVGGMVRLRSVATNLYLALDLNHHTTVLIAGTSSTTTSTSASNTSPQKETNDTTTTTTPAIPLYNLNWSLDLLTGELCYIQLGSNANPRLLMCDHLGNLRLSNKFGGWEVWRFMEAGGGQVRIASWTHSEYFLACSVQGQVSTTTNRFSNDTLWHVQRVGLDGVSIQSVPHQRYLTIYYFNGGGGGSTHGSNHGTSKGNNDSKDKKKIFPPRPFGNFGKQQQQQQQQSKEPQQQQANSISAVSVFPGRLATFRLTAAHRLLYHISSMAHDKRLSLLRNATSPKTTHHRRDCEVWHIQPLDDDDIYGYVMIVSDKWNKLLQCTPSHQLGVVLETKDQDCYSSQHQQKQEQSSSSTSSPRPQLTSSLDSDSNDMDDLAVLSAAATVERRSCIWRVIPSPVGNGVCILSAMDHGLALSCNSQGELSLVDQHDLSQCWNLEPRMPHSLERWQINLMIGGVVGAALLGPAIAMGAAGLLGAEGAAAAASVAAAAEGTAAAGTAAAGAATGAAAGAAAGTIVTTAAVAETAAAAATTAGVAFGLAETSAAVAAGAALGASATGLVVAASKRTRNEGTSFTNTSHNRPFCDWRRW